MPVKEKQRHSGDLPNYARATTIDPCGVISKRESMEASNMKFCIPEVDTCKFYSMEHYLP